MGYTLENVSVPFFADIRDGMPHNGEIEIEGEVVGTEQGIWLELRANDGIAFHLNIRMGYLKEHITIVNSHQHGKWQHEERHANNVSPGGSIQLSVSNHWNQYEFKINGKSYHFPHRISGKQITRLEIRGDLRIRRLTFKNMDKHFHVHSNQIGQSNAPQPYNPTAPQPYGQTGTIGVGPGDISQPAPYSGMGQPQPYPSQPQPQYPGQQYPNSGIGMGQQMGGQSGIGQGIGPPGMGQPSPYQPLTYDQPPGYGQGIQQPPGYGQGIQQPGQGGIGQPYGQPQPPQNDPRGYY